MEEDKTLSEIQTKVLQLQADMIYVRERLKELEKGLTRDERAALDDAEKDLAEGSTVAL